MLNLFKQKVPDISTQKIGTGTIYRMGYWSLQCISIPEVNAMSFGLYLFGFVVLVVGVAYGAFLMHMPSHWIGVIVLVLIGLGILTGVANTRQKDSS